MLLENIKKQFQKLYLKDKSYSDDTMLSQDEIDRVFEIARELEK